MPEKKNIKPEDPAPADLWSDYDIFLFKQGTHFHLYERLGSRPMDKDGVKGFYFSVWERFCDWNIQRLETGEASYEGKEGRVGPVGDFYTRSGHGFGLQISYRLSTQ